jgi:hypothetical protein
METPGLREETGHRGGNMPRITAGLNVDEENERLEDEVISHPHQELEKANVKVHLGLSSDASF